jgi:2-keto-3-deoxy-L-rhamnonate aldolase RhmA
VPWVASAAEAEAAVSAARYPPRGIRHVVSATWHRSRGPRATGFVARPFADYLEKAHEETLTIIQIERVEAVEEVEAIAAIDGMDVLFVGPLDLRISMGMLQEFDRPKFLAALQRVSDAAMAHGKAAGTLIMNPDHVAARKEMGYTFLAYGSDGSIVTQGMRNAVSLLK